MLATIAIVFACVYACSAHQCMLSPPQRSLLDNINKPGSDSCLLLAPPCGKVQPTPIYDRLWVRAGSNVTVVLQKNLDHFNADSPGYFSISIGSERHIGSMKELYRFSDSNAPALTIFSALVTIPVQPTNQTEMILQTRYLPHNSSAPNAFYQCADIIVFSDGGIIKTLN